MRISERKDGWKLSLFSASLSKFSKSLALICEQNINLVVSCENFLADKGFLSNFAAVLVDFLRYKDLFGVFYGDNR